eukprot:7199440-Heterocapsa_arctica.AAC.1
MVFVLNGKQFYVVEEMCVVYGNQNVYLALLGNGAARARDPTKMRFWQCKGLALRRAGHTGHRLFDQRAEQQRGCAAANEDMN